MSKTCGPPQRPQQATNTRQGPESVSDGSELPQTRRYPPFAAQQANGTPSGLGGLRYPPLAAPPIPTTITAATTTTTAITTTTATPAVTNLGMPPAACGPSTAEQAAARLTAAAAQDAAIAGDDDVDVDATPVLEYPYSIYNHGTWTAEDDTTLIQARKQGQNWTDLQRAHFPSKSSNACRKRYERLVERRGLNDHSGRRAEKIASEYMSMRRETWSGLAERVGMRWELVEALVRIPHARAVVLSTEWLLTVLS